MVRDLNKCVYCDSTSNLTIAHYIGRGNGGLGIEQNLAVVCAYCHRELDQGMNRPLYRRFLQEYLQGLYPDFTDKERKYDKWKNTPIQEQ